MEIIMLKRVYSKKEKPVKVLMTTYGVWCHLCKKYNCQQPYHPDPV